MASSVPPLREGNCDGLPAILQPRRPLEASYSKAQWPIPGPDRNQFGLFDPNFPAKAFRIEGAHPIPLQPVESSLRLSSTYQLLFTFQDYLKQDCLREAPLHFPVPIKLGPLKKCGLNFSFRVIIRCLTLQLWVLFWGEGLFPTVNQGLQAVPGQGAVSLVP